MTCPAEMSLRQHCTSTVVSRVALGSVARARARMSLPMNRCSGAFRSKYSARNHCSGKLFFLCQRSKTLHWHYVFAPRARNHCSELLGNHWALEITSRGRFEGTSHSKSLIEQASLYSTALENTALALSFSQISLETNPQACSATTGL